MKMSQRDKAITKHLGEHPFTEDTRDAIHDAMKEHAIEFSEWCNKDYIRLHDVWCLRYASQTNKDNWETTEQLYNKFNPNK